MTQTNEQSQARKASVIARGMGNMYPVYVGDSEVVLIFCLS